MPFTEFTCRSGGSNLNAGTLDGAAEAATAAITSLTNGAWNGSNTYTAAAGSDLTQYTAGRWVSLVPDSLTAEPVSGSYSVGRIFSVNTGTRVIVITVIVSLGTIQGSVASGKTLILGGAWKGPNGANPHPFGFVTSTLQDASLDKLRVNFKNDQTYSITAAINHASQLTYFRGYSSSFGDSSRATIDGGATGTSYTLLSITAASVVFENFIFQNNGDTGSATGVANTSGQRGSFINCVFHDFRGFGLNISGCTATECEAYNCNQSNTSSLSGINISSSTLIRCNSHDNAGANSSGFSGAGTLIDCISDSNGQHGYLGTGNFYNTIIGCDFYNNAGSGINSQTGGAHVIENSNFIKNSAFGIVLSTNCPQAVIRNCGFGSGSQVNSLGQTSAVGMAILSNNVTYAADVTPWVDPANGDFRINLAAAKGAGRGTFTETAASYAGTIGYPDIGAAQHQDAGGILQQRHMLGGLV